MGTGKWAGHGFVWGLLACACFAACSGATVGGSSPAAGAAAGDSDGGAGAGRAGAARGGAGAGPTSGPGGASGGEAGGAGPAGNGRGGAGGESDGVRGTDCKDKPFTLDAEVVRRCVMLAGCTETGAALSGGVSSCIASWPTFLSYHFYSGPGQPGHPEQPAQNWQWLPCTDAPLDSCADVENCVASAKKPALVAVSCDGKPSVATCEGNVETYCSPEGRLYTHDCAAQGLTCFTGSDDLPNALEILDCVPNGCGSEPPASQDTCDGDDLLLRFEMDPGNGARVHCSDYGFKKCDVDRCSN